MQTERNKIVNEMVVLSIIIRFLVKDRAKHRVFWMFMLAVRESVTVIKPESTSDRNPAQDL